MTEPKQSARETKLWRAIIEAETRHHRDRVDGPPLFSALALPRQLKAAAPGRVYPVGYAATMSALATEGELVVVVEHHKYPIYSRP